MVVRGGGGGAAGPGAGGVAAVSPVLVWRVHGERPPAVPLVGRSAAPAASAGGAVVGVVPVWRGEKRGRDGPAGGPALRGARAVEMLLVLLVVVPAAVVVVQQLVVGEVGGSLVVREVPVHVDVLEHGLLALEGVQQLWKRKKMKT